MNKEDQELKKLEKRLAREYQQAYSDISKKCDEYFAKFEEQDKKMKATLSHDDYIKWRQSKMLTGKRWTALRDSLAKDYTSVNKIATKIIREHSADTMAESINHGTYEIEKISGIDTNFTIYNRDSVYNIIENDPDLLPVNLNIPKDLRWNKSKVNSAITQGILQGKPIKDVAKNLESVTDMNKNAAIRNARTMNTYARNAGRLKSYERADKLGVKTRKMWLATLDGRTRHSHRMMDREIVELDEAFSNGLMEPGDPDGAGGEIYNCRCRMIGVPQGVNPNIFTDDRASAYLDDNGMSYEKWKTARQPKPKAQPNVDSESRIHNAIADSYEYHRTANGLNATPYSQLGRDFFDVKLTKMDGDLKNTISNQFESLCSRYDTTVQSIVPMDKMEYVSHINSFATTYHNYDVDTSTIMYNPAKITDVARVKELVENGFATQIDPTMADKYVITHEFAHTLIDMGSELDNKRNFLGADYDKIKNVRREINGVYDRYIAEIGSLEKTQKEVELEALTTMNEDTWKRASELSEQLKEKSLGKYSMTNSDEFMAECFTHAELGGEQNDYVDEIMSILNKHFGR